MMSFLDGFADELLKIAAPQPVHPHHDHAVPHGEEAPSGMDVVTSEALGPIASAYRGYKKGGLKGAAGAAGRFVAGAGAGGLGGFLLAKGVQKVTGHDPGIGPLRLSTAAPALGALALGLKAERA